MILGCSSCWSVFKLLLHFLERFFRHVPYTVLRCIVYCVTVEARKEMKNTTNWYLYHLITPDNKTQERAEKQVTSPDVQNKLKLIQQAFH